MLQELGSAVVPLLLLARANMSASRSNIDIDIILVPCRIHQWKDPAFSCDIIIVFVEDTAILLDKHQVTKKS
jgi:hypothetical protein